MEAVPQGDVQFGSASFLKYQFITRKQMAKHNTAKQLLRVFEEHRKLLLRVFQRHAQEARRTRRSSTCKSVNDVWSRHGSWSQYFEHDIKTVVPTSVVIFYGLAEDCPLWHRGHCLMMDHLCGALSNAKPTEEPTTGGIGSNFPHGQVKLLLEFC